jgi:hypothetical protein
VKQKLLKQRKPLGKILVKQERVGKPAEKMKQAKAGKVIFRVK